MSLYSTFIVSKVTLAEPLHRLWYKHLPVVDILTDQNNNG